MDNIAPSGPVNLQIELVEIPEGSLQSVNALAVKLSWAVNEEDIDVSVYNIYRGSTPDFPRDETTLLGSTSGLEYIDYSPPLGSPMFYSLSGMDFHGNSSSGTTAISIQQYVPRAGWNMLSVSLSVKDNTKSVLFPSSSSEAFYYHDGYVTESVMQNGFDYWLKFPSETGPFYLGGTARAEEIIEVREGWNMIGSISSAVDVTSIGSNPPGIVTSEFFRYNGSYITSSVIVPGQAYWVKVSPGGELILSSSEALTSAKIRIVSTDEVPPLLPTEDESLAIPTEFTLQQNYPNPFNPVTKISYGLPNTEHVRLSIYNMLGQEVATLVDEMQDTGYKTVEFDAGNLPSGIYTYRLTAGTFTDVKKMLLLK